jgi:cell wall-associated NlpC family hydrolase
MSGDCSLRVFQGAVVAGATAALLLTGCGSSEPRFRNEAREEEAEEEVRFAPRIREEESREDDRKFDPALWKQRAGHVIPSREDLTPAGLSRDMLLLEALSYLGVPYSYGGNGKDGIDCSGFTSRVYRGGAEILLPRSTTEQFRVGEEVERDSLLFGDLVFFNTTGRRPSHVGIYLEDGLFAHASVTYGVTISSLESTYYRNRFIAGRRVVRGGAKQ